MIIDKIKANKILERAKMNYKQLTYICPLCNKIIYQTDEYIYAKSKLHERFAHLDCYNRLIRRKLN